MTVKAVIFDFDYTLENFGRAERFGEKELARLVEKKFNINKNLFLKEFYSNKNKFLKKRKKPIYYSRGLWTARALKNLNVKFKKSEVKKLETLFWEKVSSKISLYKHTKKVLSMLKRKFRLALLTDSDGRRKFKMMRVKKLGIEKYFDVIITTDQIKFNKPDKRCFLAAAKKLRVKPQECIMIGDHPETDLLGAKRVGMKTVWLMKGPYAKARKNYDYIDYKARNILEVYDKVKSIYSKEL